MNNKEFVEVLHKAIQGDFMALNKIINEYNELIFKHSTINGLLDEDCVSTIRYALIKSIPKFRNF